MTEVIGYFLLALVVAFATYRDICLLRYERAKRTQRPFTGLRIVYRRHARILPFQRKDVA